MHFTTVSAGLLSLFVIGVTAAPASSPLTTRQTTDSAADTIGLYLNGSNFDINYLQTFRVSYANTSAYIGAIKYQSYSEPLVAGALAAGADNSVSFLSIHQSPTGFQQMYVVPHQSRPLGFSVPHGGAPQGVRTTGFSFAADGTLLNNGLNLFYACQDAALADLNSYQIYWLASARPAGLTCKGPIKIQAGDACSRY